MTDMTQAIKPKSDQLNADDLIGGPLTITVTDVSIASTDQPVSIRYEGDEGKPFKPCKSMCRVLVFIWGRDAKEYKGKSMTLYRDAEVTWAGMKVGGIRISHMSGIDKAVTLSLTATKSNRKPFTVKPLTNVPTTPVKKEVDVTSIVKEGDAAAGKGMAEFKAWAGNLNITDDQRAALAEYKAGWSAKAKEADELNNKDEDDIPL